MEPSWYPLVEACWTPVACAPDICLSEFCLIAFCFPVWLQDKAVGAPDLQLHVGRSGCSRGEHVPEVGTTRRLAMFASKDQTWQGGYAAVRHTPPRPRMAPGDSEAVEQRVLVVGAALTFWAVVKKSSRQKRPETE